jgi:hypothetical protein
MGELRRPAQMGEGFRTYSTAHTHRYYQPQRLDEVSDARSAVTGSTVTVLWDHAAHFRSLFVYTC